jgi:hypothetical protein
MQYEKYRHVLCGIPQFYNTFVLQFYKCIVLQYFTIFTILF